MKKRSPRILNGALFLVGAALIFVQQIPRFKDNYYDLIRTYIYIVFGLLSVISFVLVFKKRGRASLVNVFAVFVAAIGFELLVIYLVGWSPEFGDLLETVVPFGLVVSSYALSLDKRTLTAVAKTYAVVVMAISILQVFYYAGGFLLYEQYIVSDKNIIGSFVAAASVIAFHFALDHFDSGRGLASLLWAGIFGMLSAILVTIRSRAALLSVIAVIFLMIVKSRRILRKLVVAISVTALVAVLFSGMLQFALNSVRQSVVLGYEFSDVDALSGGRFGVYSEALEIIRGDPLFGELAAKDRSPRIPHNYLLNKAKKYGLVGGAVFFSLYVYFILFMFKRIRQVKGISIWDLPIFLLAIPFVISLLEYQHPYGPGASHAFIYFMLGQYLLASSPGRAGRAPAGRAPASPTLRDSGTIDQMPEISSSIRRAPLTGIRRPNP